MNTMLIRLPAAPPFLLSAGLLVWGWQNGFLLMAIPMAVVLELARMVNWRWPVTDREMNNVSDLSSVILLVVAIYLFTDKGAKGIFTLLSVVPFVLYPLLLVQLYSERGRIRLSALFVSLRRPGAARFPEAQADTDLSLSYFTGCLVAASAGNSQRLLFFIVLCIVFGILLWYLRPRRYPAWLWGGVVLLAVALGYAGQMGMIRMQMVAESTVIEILDRFMWRYRDPDMATTAIGTLGRIKLSDRVMLRVKTAEPIRSTLLLREASYDTYGYGIWSNRKRPFETLDPEASGKSWKLSANPGETRLSVSTYMVKEAGVIPLPHGVARVRSDEATAVSRNPLGAVKMDIREGWVQFSASYGNGLPPDSPPTDDDRYINDSNRPDFDRLVSELGLQGLAPERIVEVVERHFAENFTYTLSPRQRFPRGGYLADFLFETRSGHCEFFATSTVLLLRAAGIPARYAVGYAVDEYSGLENQYVARARHAHSWTLVWLNNRWQVLDTTPAVWAAFESEQASGFQGLLDIWSYLSFRLARLGSKDAEADEETNSALLWLLIPLVSLLVWRLYFKERVARAGKAPAEDMPDELRPGKDSMIYQLVAALEPQAGVRNAGETLSAWLDRACGKLELDSPAPALRLHYRYRFDPAGLAASERSALEQSVRHLLEQWRARAAVRNATRAV